MMSRLPHAVQKRGSLLLNQQCWLWGQDVRRPEGNVLIAQGFERVPPPQGTQGCSQYTLHLPGTLQVRLWGWGMYYGGDNGIYVNRYGFQPVQAHPGGDLWTPKVFVEQPPSQDLAALAAAVRWIVAFEQSIQQRFGVSYREHCLLGWNRRALAPHDLLCGWQALACQLRTYADRPVAAASGQLVRKPGPVPGL